MLGRDLLRFILLASMASEVVSERDNKTGPYLANLSVTTGIIFCVVGVLMIFGFVSSGFLQGTFGLVTGASYVPPTFGCGVLLIVADHILRAVHRANDD